MTFQTPSAQIPTNQVTTTLILFFDNKKLSIMFMTALSESYTLYLLT